MCWDLHGKPPTWRVNIAAIESIVTQGENSYNPSSIVAAFDEASPSGEPVQFSKADFDALIQRVSRLEGSSTTSTALAHIGIPSALHVSFSSSSWVIDSGAIDHMSGTVQSFQSLITDKYLGNVKLADGTLTTFGGKGNIQISQSLTSSYVLHVLNLSSNLLSVSSLIKNLNCSMMFFPTHCVI